MIYTRCAICQSTLVSNGTTAFMQSSRFPTVFIHGGNCSASISRVVASEGWSWNILCEELLSNDSAIAKKVMIPISNIRENLRIKRVRSRYATQAD